LTGDATGVANAVEAASATVISIGYGDTSSSSAAWNAIGASSTAVAVLLITWLATDVSTNSPASIAKRPERTEAADEPVDGELQAAGDLERRRHRQDGGDQHDRLPVDAAVGVVHRQAARQHHQHGGHAHRHDVRHPAEGHHHEHREHDRQRDGGAVGPRRLGLQRARIGEDDGVEPLAAQQLDRPSADPRPAACRRSAASAAPGPR
jgi:hypothetical protein